MIGSAKSPNFSGMADATLASFLRYCHKREYPNKTDIMQPGDVADTLYYIVDGSVSIRVEETDGHEFILANLSRGDFIGEAGFFLPQESRGVYVQTRSPCTLAGITYAQLTTLMEHQLAAESKEILHALGKQLSHRLLQTSRKAKHLAFLDVTGRIARTLLDLCKEPDAMTHPDGMQIRITRQDIGRMVGCSREMAGRVLKNMDAEGAIHVKGKTIVVFGAR